MLYMIFKRWWNKMMISIGFVETIVELSLSRVGQPTVSEFPRESLTDFQLFSGLTNQFGMPAAPPSTQNCRKLSRYSCCGHFTTPWRPISWGRWRPFPGIPGWTSRSFPGSSSLQRGRRRRWTPCLSCAGDPRSGSWISATMTNNRYR